MAVPVPGSVAVPVLGSVAVPVPGSVVLPVLGSVAVPVSGSVVVPVLLELLELPEEELLPEDFTGALAAAVSARVPLVTPREPFLFRYMIWRSASVMSSV